MADRVVYSTTQEVLSEILQQVVNSDDEGATVGPRSLLANTDSGRPRSDALDNEGIALNVDTQLRMGPSVSFILEDDGREEPALGQGRDPAGPGLGEENRSTRSLISQPRWHIKLGISMTVSPLDHSENQLMGTTHSTIDHIPTDFITLRHQPRALEPEPRPVNGRSGSRHSNTYCCVTEGLADAGIVSAQIGYGDHIPRWSPGSVLTYVICDETFPTPGVAAFASRQLKKAIHMWNGVGVSFKQIKRHQKASFRVVYRQTAGNGNAGTLAQSFLPNQGPANERTLYIYRLAFSKAHRKYQANFLAHEVGHILGLRHEFAMEKEPKDWSATFGNRNPRSVMGYHDPSEWCVQPEDLEHVRAFYEDSMKIYQGKPVTDFKPQRFDYPKN